MDVILESVMYSGDEYSAVPEIHRCRYCEFEPATLAQCQRAIGKPDIDSRQAFGMVYCQETANPHKVGLIWIKTKDLPDYIALAVAKRMEAGDE